MIVYKAYHSKLGWSHNYKQIGRKLAFDFGKGYSENWDCGKNRVCIGFQLLNKWNHREESISSLLNDDFSTIFTGHYYSYPTELNTLYHSLEKPLFLVKYECGVFYYEYEYGSSSYRIPINYSDSIISNNYINPRLLKLIGNIYEDQDKIKQLKIEYEK